MGFWPNAGHPYADGPIIPNSSSSPVTIDLCVQAYSDANACAAAQSSPSFCGTISIPSGSTACSGGGHGWGAPNSKGTVVDGKTSALQSASGNAVFPNPATNVVNVTFDGTAKHTVELVSVTGKIYKKIENNATDRLQIDVSDLPKAVYFIIIYENNQVVSRQKVMVL